MTDANGVARDQLRAFVERIERLEDEKKTIADDIKDVYGEAKGMGFDTRILKKVIALRKKDEQERTEEEMILDTYLAALGMIPQFEMFERDEVKPASRDERRRQFMSEDMADHKALIDEMADLGMISEEARHENKALADAVATKFGNGPAMALQSPRKAAEAVSERTRVNLPIGAEQAEPEAAAEVAGDDLREPVAAEQGQIIREGDAPRETDCLGDDASSLDTDHEAVAHVAKALPSAERVSPANGGSAAANTGGDHVSLEPPAATHQAGAIVGNSAPAINERCLNIGGCKFDHHPNKIVCSPCQKAWETRKLAVPA